MKNMALLVVMLKKIVRNNLRGNYEIMIRKLELSVHHGSLVVSES